MHRGLLRSIQFESAFETHVQSLVDYFEVRNFSFFFKIVFVPWLWLKSITTTSLASTLLVTLRARAKHLNHRHFNQVLGFSIIYPCKLIQLIIFFFWKLTRFLDIGCISKWFYLRIHSSAQTHSRWSSVSFCQHLMLWTVWNIWVFLKKHRECGQFFAKISENTHTHTSIRQAKKRNQRVFK